MKAYVTLSCQSASSSCLKRRVRPKLSFSRSDKTSLRTRWYPSMPANESQPVSSVWETKAPLSRNRLLLLVNGFSAHRESRVAPQAQAPHRVPKRATSRWTRSSRHSCKRGLPLHWATLRMHMPKHFLRPGCTEEAYHAHLAERDTEAERKVRKDMRAKGRHRFCGTKKAMSKSPKSSPTTKAYQGNRSPRFVAVTKLALVAIKQKLKAFYTAYREALARFQSGNRGTLFPAGTWKMTRTFSCKAAA